jgi:hypothetical protein
MKRGLLVTETDGTNAILIIIPTTATLSEALLLFSNTMIMIVELLCTILTSTTLLDPLLFGNIMDLQTTKKLLQINMRAWRLARQRQLVGAKHYNKEHRQLLINTSASTSKIIIMHQLSAMKTIHIMSMKTQLSSLHQHGCHLIPRHI